MTGYTKILPVVAVSLLPAFWLSAAHSALMFTEDINFALSPSIGTLHALASSAKLISGLLSLSFNKVS